MSLGVLTPWVHLELQKLSPTTPECPRGPRDISLNKCNEKNVLCDVVPSYVPRRLRNVLNVFITVLPKSKGPLPQENVYQLLRGEDLYSLSSTVPIEALDPRGHFARLHVSKLQKHAEHMQMSADVAHNFLHFWNSNIISAAKKNPAGNKSYRVALSGPN